MNGMRGVVVRVAIKAVLPDRATLVRDLPHARSRVLSLTPFWIQAFFFI